MKLYRGSVAHLLDGRTVEAAWQSMKAGNRKFFQTPPDALRPLVEAIGLGEPEYMVMNRDDPVELHFDHDVPGDRRPDIGTRISALAVAIPRGTVEGHALAFPELGKSYELAHGDLLIFDSRELHENTPRTGGRGTRTSILAYYDVVGRFKDDLSAASILEHDGQPC